jgi:hypothetical protein
LESLLKEESSFLEAREKEKKKSKVESIILVPFMSFKIGFHEDPNPRHRPQMEV